MRQFISRYGDPMPDDNTIQLPVSSRKELFECYTLDPTTDLATCFKQNTFTSFLRQFYRHVLIHRYKKFKACRYCLKCDKNIADQNLSPEVRALWADAKRMHREHVRAEKQKYYHHRFKATQSPDKYCSLIVDGMDQSKGAAPGFHRECDRNGFCIAGPESVNTEHLNSRCIQADARWYLPAKSWRDLANWVPRLNVLRDT